MGYLNLTLDLASHYPWHLPANSPCITNVNESITLYVKVYRQKRAYCEDENLLCDIVHGITSSRVDSRRPVEPVRFVTAMPQTPHKHSLGERVLSVANMTRVSVRRQVYHGQLPALKMS